MVLPRPPRTYADFTLKCVYRYVDTFKFDNSMPQSVTGNNIGTYLLNIIYNEKFLITETVYILKMRQLKGHQ